MRLLQGPWRERRLLVVGALLLVIFAVLLGVRTIRRSRHFNFAVAEPLSIARDRKGQRIAVRSASGQNDLLQIFTSYGAELNRLEVPHSDGMLVSPSGTKVAIRRPGTGTDAAVVDLEHPEEKAPPYPDEWPIAWGPGQHQLFFRMKGYEPAIPHIYCSREPVREAGYRELRLESLFHRQVEFENFVFSHDGRKIALLEKYEARPQLPGALRQWRRSGNLGRVLVMEWPRLRSLAHLQGTGWRNVAFSRDDSEVVGIRYDGTAGAQGGAGPLTTATLSRVHIETRKATDFPLEKPGYPGLVLTSGGQLVVGPGGSENPVGVWSALTGKYLGGLEPALESGETGPPLLETTPGPDSLVLARKGRLHFHDMKPFLAEASKP